MIDSVLLIGGFRFGSLSRASYASPAFDTTNWSSNWSSERAQQYCAIQAAHFFFTLARGNRVFVSREILGMCLSQEFREGLGWSMVSKCLTDVKRHRRSVGHRSNGADGLNMATKELSMLQAIQLVQVSHERN